MSSTNKMIIMKTFSYKKCDINPCTCCNKRKTWQQFNRYILSIIVLNVQLFQVSHWSQISCKVTRFIRKKYL